MTVPARSQKKRTTPVPLLQRRQRSPPGWKRLAVENCCPETGRNPESGLGVGLELIPEGLVESNWGDPLELESDGFAVLFFGKAGTLYYFRDGQVHEYGLSD